MNILATWMEGLVATVFVLTCLLLILVILLQKGRGGGLSGAFGGVGGHSAFGAKTGDFFTYVTIALTVLFVAVACAGKFVFTPSDDTPTSAQITDEAGGAGGEGGTAPGAPADPAQ